MKRVVFLFLLIVPFALVASAQEGSSKPRRAPQFVLPTPEGEKVALRDFQGRVVLLQFFETTCPTCQQEAPMLEELYKTYKDQDFVLLGVSHESGGAEALGKFAKEFAVTFPLVLGDLEVAVRYLGVTPQRSGFDIPHFFLISRDGYILQEFPPESGFLGNEKEIFQKAIKEALAGSPSAVGN